MKLLFLFLFFIATASATATDYEGMPYMDPYVIVSDSIDPSLEPGTVKVYGNVYLGYNYPIANGTIATLNRSKSAVTGADGSYSVLLTAADTAVFFFHPEYGETVIWNYKFKSQHTVRINFYMRSKADENQMVKKPVIYLYSDKEEEVSIRLNAPEVTFTYPAYQTGWKVKTLAGGGVEDLATGKKYPYLFWEGEDRLYYAGNAGMIPGSFLATDTLASFLENQLGALGLTAVETTDFVTFWAPQLMQKHFVFIQFLIDDQYDEMIAGIEVSPKPDTQRRIFMQYTLLDKPAVPFEFQPQQFSQLVRKGLTLVEWGGGEINLVNTP
jgi:hypothetical protein